MGVATLPNNRPQWVILETNCLNYLPRGEFDICINMFNISEYIARHKTLR